MRLAGVPIGADRNPTLIEFGIRYQRVMLLRQRVPIGCRFTHLRHYPTCNPQN